MSDSESMERVARLLEEIRDQQKIQLERQAESLAIQSQQYQAFLTQYEKATKLQDRAEKIQERSAQMVGVIRRFVPIATLMVAVLIAYVAWSLLRIGR